MEMYGKDGEEGYYGKDWDPELKEMWDTKLTINRFSWRKSFSFLELFIDESLWFFSYFNSWRQDSNE